MVFVKLNYPIKLNIFENLDNNDYKLFYN